MLELKSFKVRTLSSASVQANILTVKVYKLTSDAEDGDFTTSEANTSTTTSKCQQHPVFPSQQPTFATTSSLPSSLLASSPFCDLTERDLAFIDFIEQPKIFSLHPRCPPQ